MSSPEMSLKMKRGAKSAVEAELAKAMEKLEIEESTGDELRKAQLQVKRALAKAMCMFRFLVFLFNRALTHLSLSAKSLGPLDSLLFCFLPFSFRLSRGFVEA